MIAKFELKVTVHYIAYGQNVPSCDPLRCVLSNKPFNASK